MIFIKLGRGKKARKKKYLGRPIGLLLRSRVTVRQGPTHEGGRCRRGGGEHGIRDTERERNRTKCVRESRCTHARARARMLHTRTMRGIESNRAESGSQERRKDEAGQSADHQSRLERSGRPAVDSLES